MKLSSAIVQVPHVHLAVTQIHAPMTTLQPAMLSLPDCYQTLTVIDSVHYVALLAAYALPVLDATDSD